MTKTKTNKGMTDLEDLEKLTNPDAFKSKIDLGAIPKFNKHGDNIDPIIRSIPIHSIDEYAFNPRQADNDHFESIKESIEKVGLQQRFSVVKNPETQRYTLVKGGNTRLLAFKMLYRETGDTQFASIDCIVEPWDGELNKTQAVIAHLVENEARGELILVDKAKALIELEQEYKNNGVESLTSGQTKLENSNIKSLRTPQTKLENSNISTTTKEFVNYLKDNGYSVSENQLGLFRFAATRLTGNLDNFLNQGLGSPQIIKIRAVFNNIKRIIKEAEVEDYGLDSIDLDFSAALKKYNKTRKPFDFEKLLNVIIEQLSGIYPFFDIFANNHSNFKIELLSATRKSKPTEKEVTYIENNDSKGILMDEKESKDSLDSQKDNSGEVIETEEVTADGVDVDNNDKQESNPAEQQTVDPLALVESEITVHLDLYRKQAINLVTKITNKLNISKVVKEIGTGCGFLLIDVIDGSKNDFEHWGVWWLLLGYSHAADILNPIVDVRTLGFDYSALDEKLASLYIKVSLKDVEATDDCLKKINELSDMYEFRSPNLQSVKDGLVPHMWQDITELESICYQIIRTVKTGETGFTIWS